MKEQSLLWIFCRKIGKLCLSSTKSCAFIPLQTVIFLLHKCNWHSHKNDSASIIIYFLSDMFSVFMSTCLFVFFEELMFFCFLHQYCLSGHPTLPCNILKYKSTTIMLDCGLDMTSALHFLPLPLVHRYVCSWNLFNWVPCHYRVTLELSNQKPDVKLQNPD